MASFADIAATALLSLPCIVLAWHYAQKREFYWSRHDSMAHFYEAPRILLAAVALAAAVCLRRRHGRAAGVALGTVAVLGAAIVAVTSADRWYLYWPDYGPFGGDGWMNVAWLVLTGAALALVPRRVEPVPARHSAAQVRGLVRFVPRSLAVVAAAALLTLTWEKLQTIGDHGCGGSLGDGWRDTDILLTSADLLAAFLVLVPGTRLTGLRFAVVLFEGTVAWLASQWLRLGAPSDRFTGLGALGGSWAVHVSIAAILAAAFAAAYVRELHVHSAGAFARRGCPAPRSRVPALFVRFRAFRRFHRESGARLVWAAPVGAAGLAVLGATTIASVARDVMAPLVYEDAPRQGDADVMLALAAAQFVAAAWLLRADRRLRGAVVGSLSTGAGIVMRMATAHTPRDEGPVSTLVWLAVCASCALAASGLPRTDASAWRSWSLRAGASLDALRDRLSSIR